MIGIPDSCVACGLLLAMTFTFSLSQSTRCHLNSRPHPEGICGDSLTTAHANLCFLLKQLYPNTFRDDKRSASWYSSHSHSSPGHLRGTKTEEEDEEEDIAAVERGGQTRSRRTLSGLERIYSIPVSLLAQIHLTDENWRSFVYKRGQREALARETTGEFQFTDKDLAQLPVLMGSQAKLLLRMLSKRSYSVQKRTTGLACDCCYNPCTARNLATYC